MRTLLIISALVVYHQDNYGQQTIPITKDREGYYEEYSVLESDKKVKHGSYMKLNKPPLGGYAIESSGNYSNGLKSEYWESYYENNNNIRSKGFYKNNIKDSLWVYFYPEGIPRKLVEVQSDQGIFLKIVDADPVASMTGSYKNGTLAGEWEYFDQRGVISQKYDHDVDSLLFCDNKDLNNIEAGFIGGEFLLKQHLYDLFDYEELMNSVNTKVSLESGKISFRFTIDEKGQVVDITEVANTIGNKKIYARALETTQNLTKTFYPKRENGRPQSSTKTINFSLNVESTYENISNEKWTFSKKTMGLNLIIQVI